MRTRKTLALKKKQPALQRAFLALMVPSRKTRSCHDWAHSPRKMAPICRDSALPSLDRLPATTPPIRLPVRNNKNRRRPRVLEKTSVGETRTHALTVGNEQMVTIPENKMVDDHGARKPDVHALRCTWMTFLLHTDDAGALRRADARTDACADSWAYA